jgi:hypothetical protein
MALQVRYRCAQISYSSKKAAPIGSDWAAGATTAATGKFRPCPGTGNDCKERNQNEQDDAMIPVMRKVAQSVGGQRVRRPDRPSTSDFRG